MPSTLMLYRDDIVICGHAGCRWTIELAAARADEKIEQHRQKHLQEVSNGQANADSD